MSPLRWDWVIIGSGFGGSVSALRLAEKGHSVLVLEKGGRWEEENFPKTNWNLRRWLWMPKIGFRGFFQMTFLRHITALSGVGVGGGSLVYANTLPMPGEDFFQADEWGHLADWRSELAPHYRTARSMLGVIDNPLVTAPDRILRAVAREMGREGFFKTVPVGVYFGTPGVTVPDPYHGGEGPNRTGCTFCGGCMTGCRYGSKNTLDRNYLWCAERRGAQVMPDTEVTWVQPIPTAARAETPAKDQPRYRITAKERKSLFRSHQRTFDARNVIFAGGVLGTVQLLHQLRQAPDGLPRLSPRVGDRIRTNSEVLVGVTTGQRDVDLSEGIAITSSLQTDDHSWVEPVRFSRGSGFFRILAMPHGPGKTVLRRLANAAGRVIRSPWRFMRAYFVRDWARFTTTLLYMRTSEGHLRFITKKGLLRRAPARLTTAPGDGPLPTAAIPEATQVAEAYAGEVDGWVGSLLTETLFGIPTTAHILGGACMGANRDEGVIDHRHRVFGYEGLFVIDGSAVSGNPGVNPSLTITALAERAMSLIPEKRHPEDGGQQGGGDRSADRFKGKEGLEGLENTLHPKRDG